MPAAFQAAGAVAQSDVGNVTPAWPAHVAGDIGLLLIESGGWWAQLLALSGWQRVPGAPRRAGQETQSSNVYLDVWWKRAASGAEAAPTVQFVRNRLRAVILTVRGAAPSNRPFTAAEGDSEGVSTSVNAPSVTTTESNQLVMNIVANSTFTNTAQGSGWANGALTSLTEVFDSNAAIGDGSGFSVVTGLKATPGAVGSTTGVLATSSNKAMVTIAFTDVTQPSDKLPWIAKFGTEAERSTAGTIAPAWPEHVAGDIGILVIESGAWPVTVPTPSGFSAIANNPMSAGLSNTSPATSLSVWWKRATSGAEAAPIIDYIGDHVRALIFTIKNAPASGTPFDAIDHTSTGVASSTMDYASVTTTKPDELILLIGSHSIDSTSPDHGSEIVNAGLTNVTKVYERSSAIGNGSGIMVARGTKKVAGATGVSTSTLDTSSHNVGATLSVLPSAVENVTPVDTAHFVLTPKQVYHKVNFVTPVTTGHFALTPKNVTDSVHTHYTDVVPTAHFALTMREVTFRKRFGSWERGSEAPTTVWTKQPKLES